VGVVSLQNCEVRNAPSNAEENYFELVAPYRYYFNPRILILWNFWLLSCLFFV
jgi:hypothetical protein